MNKNSTSLRSRQRLRVFDAYRGRGRRTNPLWLIYSVKTNRDWIFSSDRQLVHWLVFLESNPAVKTFDVSEDVNLQGIQSCVLVHLVDGTKQTHFVISGNPSDAARDRLQERQITDGIVEPRDYRIYSDVELKPVVPLAMRWHKALAFAAALRDQEHAHVRLSLVQYLRSTGSGTVGSVIDAMPEFEQSLLLGILVRVAVEAHVSLNLTELRFCYATPWNYIERINHVVP